MRRRAVVLSALAASAPLARALPALPVLPADDGSLQFAHLHTGERLTVQYRRQGRYVPEALAAVNHLLRDFRNDEVGHIDPALLDLLHALQARTQSRRPFEIISGYRSAATNAMLHARSSGVATQSLHMVGQAIDIRLADVPLRSLRDAARGLQGGGVGFYPGADFVHVDTGRVRYW